MTAASITTMEVDTPLASHAQPMIVDPPGAWMDALAEPPVFLISQWVPRGTVTLLGAHGGAGKSTLALILAAHVACGASFCGHDVTPGRTLFVSLEDPLGIVRYRLRRIVAAYGLDAESARQRVQLVDGAAMDAALAFEQREEGCVRLLPSVHFEQLSELARGFDLVVIDNASDAYDANANDPRGVRTFVRQMLGKVARDTGSGVLLLAHIDKSAARNGSSGNTYTGTTAWHNSARSRLALISSNGGLELVHEKHNLSDKAAPVRLRWDECGMLRPIDSSDLPAQDDGLEILAAMARARRDGVDVTAARSGPATTHGCLTRYGLPDTLCGPDGRSRFYSALDRLRDTSKIIAETYRNAERKQKARLVLAPSAPVRAEAAEIADRKMRS